MWGLPQAGILANKRLFCKLAPCGYFKSTNTPGLWHHESKPITHTLVVDNFGVKFVNKVSVDHLISSIKQLYTLFIYLALAKSALPGQFDLLVSSQSKENASKYFCLFRWAAQNKSGDFWAAQKYFIIPEQHKFLLFVSFIAQNWLTLSSKNLILEQHKMLDFLKG